MKCEEIENSSNTKTNLHLEADLEISVDSRGSFGDSAIMHQVNFDIEVPEVLGSLGHREDATDDLVLAYIELLAEEEPCLGPVSPGVAGRGCQADSPVTLTEYRLKIGCKAL